MRSSVELVCVPPTMVDQVWPLVWHLIDAATAHCGDWTTEQVRGALAKDALLWITVQEREVLAAAVTRLLKTPRDLLCEAVACGGSDEDWPERLRPIEEYAAKEGCSRFRVAGRKGWARIFREYETAWVTLEKRI